VHIFAVTKPVLAYINTQIGPEAIVPVGGEDSFPTAVDQIIALGVFGLIHETTDFGKENVVFNLQAAGGGKRFTDNATGALIPGVVNVGVKKDGPGYPGIPLHTVALVKGIDIFLFTYLVGAGLPGGVKGNFLSTGVSGDKYEQAATGEPRAKKKLFMKL